MKTTRFYFMCLNAAFLVLFAASVGMSAQSVNNSSNFNSRENSVRIPPENVIKAFYKWYINAVEGGSDPFKKGRVTLQKYVTLRLIRQIERAESDGSDADAFLQTQEWDKDWANTAIVSKLKVKGATATAIVTFDVEVNYPRVLITLVKEAGIWKIDKVKNAPL